MFGISPEDPNKKSANDSQMNDGEDPADLALPNKRKPTPVEQLFFLVPEIMEQSSKAMREDFFLSKRIIIYLFYFGIGESDEGGLLFE
jgi:hypothetical protein